MKSENFAQIIISSQSKEIDRIFCYKIPDDMSVSVGMRVIIPFGKGNRACEGYIVGFTDNPEVEESRLKYILKKIDENPIFTEDMLALAYYMKEKYFSTLSSCLSCILPAGIKMRSTLSSRKKFVAIAENKEEAVKEIINRNTPQSKVLSYLLQHKESDYGSIREALKVSVSPIQTLVRKGILIESVKSIGRVPHINHEANKTINLQLNEEQESAFAFIYEKIKINKFKPTLIRGVTGSGKTEIYLQLIEKVMEDDKQAIVLVPEISLTPQTVERFYNRFGAKVAVTHSRLSNAERFAQWERARNSEISVMIGPRSALFTPFNNLGIIIIDEEHETSYKSDLSPKYSALEIALYLCENQRVHLVMGSATPSLESYYNALHGNYDLTLLNKRINKSMPNVCIEDMRIELAEGNLSIFSRALQIAMKESLDKKEQIILFLNRRGHSSFVSCRKCGHVMSCDSCNVNFTYHKFSNTLMCHYCGQTISNPSNCPVCGSKFIRYFGIGTQRIEEEAKKFFPEAKVLRMDMDTTTGKNSHENILTAFKERKADILVGTQMIAKGLDFPSVTLVGVISADISLNTGDFRSGEITFQLLTQVAGRAGRANLTGRVFIQTYKPEHYSIMYAKNHDYESFYKHEITIREQMMYPPFTRVFSMLLVGEDEKKIIVLLYRLTDIMKHYDKDERFETIGPAPAFISKIKKQYRWRLILKALDEDKLRKFVLFCIDKLKKYEDTSGITFILTPNPVSIQ